jgi:hypothetical protein
MTKNASTIEVPFLRVKRSKADAFTSATTMSTCTRPSRVAQMLALAHAMRRLLDQGAVYGHGDLAVIAGVTRPRVTQLLDLTLLAPDIQEELLFAHRLPGREMVTERTLRAIVRCLGWTEQRCRWRSMRSAASS